jgi:hypothetical protein
MIQRPIFKPGSPDSSMKINMNQLPRIDALPLNSEVAK